MFVAAQTTVSVPRRTTDAVMSGCILDVFPGQPGPDFHLWTPIASVFVAMRTAVAATAVTAAYDLHGVGSPVTGLFAVGPEI